MWNGGLGPGLDWVRGRGASFGMLRGRPPLVLAAMCVASFRALAWSVVFLLCVFVREVCPVWGPLCVSVCACGSGDFETWVRSVRQQNLSKVQFLPTHRQT